MKTRSIVKFIFFLLKEATIISVYVLCMLIILSFVSFGYLLSKTSLGNSLEKQSIAQTSTIYDRSGTHILYEIHGEENRKIISHDQIPDTIRFATIAIEDDKFYRHHGIDFLSIMRAIKRDIETRSLKEGGSTITQQLARNVYLSREKTIRRKILEFAYAIKLEKKYSKDEILDSYLNQVPYGSNNYGIETASQTYFKKNAKDLTLDEAALLASLTKAPSYYSPYGPHRKELIYRQKNTLLRIAELGLESKENVRKALAVDTFEKLIPFTQPIQAPHFVFYTLDSLNKEFDKQKLFQGGLKIYTTLDYDKQKLAEKILIESDVHLKNYGAENAALVAIDPKNGQILAMAGSKDFFDPKIDGEVNVTIQPRQPGSSFKPIVYAKAFEKGYQPETLVLDANTDFGPDGSGENYIPRNYDGNFSGIVSMRQALAMSLNIPAIKALRAVGLDEAIEMAHRLGITTLNDRNRYGLSLVIGGGEVTLLDETSAFSVFANDGKRNPVNSILKITDSTGNIIEENTPQNIPVIDPQIARKINSVLSDNQSRAPVFGPQSKLLIPGYTVAAKTGTTQEYRDAWTVGYTPNIAVGVWAGNNDYRPMKPGSAGTFVAAPIWNKFISGVVNTYPKDTFLAYNKEPTKEALLENSFSDQFPIKEKITYYKIASGKEISKEKAEKLGAKEVRKKVEYTFSGSEGESFSGPDKPIL